ncbi:efflux RND transporter periplasmic adaptor subunit [candidate division KSB1 bacterium]|nr:efflux RND transporter periplasmic adaptor subunit [candidate division KSB1 bacterium]
MKYTGLIAVAFAAILFAFGCGGGTADHAQNDEHAHEGEQAHEGEHGDHGADEHGHGPGEGGVVETIWQDNLEMFGEWPQFLAGQSSRAVLHFTSLITFDPATDGPLTITWQQGERVVKSQVADTVTRTGIFIVEVLPPDPGTYRMTMTLASPQMSGTITLDGVHVYQGKAPEMPHAEGGEEEISFLKEQQWVLGTKTGLVERRDIHDNVRAPGELKAAGNRASEVYAPFAGALLPDHKFGAVRHGQVVRKGQALAMISPSPNAENSWYELLGEYRLAKAEMTRVEKLYESQAVSQRRVEEARQRLTVKEAQLMAALGGAELDDVDSETPHFTVRAPRDGVIAHHDVAYGAYVQPGQRLFSVINPEIVWLEIQAAAADIHNANDISRAFFTISGSGIVYSTDQFEGNVIASGSVLDPITRRIPVTFELKNSDGLLKVGEFVQVDLQTSVARRALAVQKSAILEDGGSTVAYVQAGGESFVRRVVTTGAIDGPWIEVLAGLKEGERVATAGAYKIKLASGSTGEVGHGHAH